MVCKEPVNALTAGQRIDVVVVEHGLRRSVITHKLVAQSQTGATRDVSNPSRIAVAAGPFLHQSTDGCVVIVVRRIARDQNIFFLITYDAVSTNASVESATICGEDVGPVVSVKVSNRYGGKSESADHAGNITVIRRREPPEPVSQHYSHFAEIGKSSIKVPGSISRYEIVIAIPVEVRQR